MRWILTLVLLAVMMLFTTPSAHAVGYVHVQVELEKLPQDHEYQRTLRSFMAKLTVADFVIEKREFTESAMRASSTPDSINDYNFQMWVLAQTLPEISALMLPPDGFTLAAIESKKGIAVPTQPNESLMLSWISTWKSAGNPYLNSKPARLRAFMLAATDMMVLDYLYDNNPRDADRSDYLGGNLIWIGFTYRAAKDLLPKDVQAAFETGLKRHAQRLEKWGPKGHMTDMDLFASVGLYYIREATNDEETKKIADRYTKLLYTNPLYFNEAGYFVDNHCFDTSYNGISLFFGAWAASLTPKNPARDAIEKAYFLREHLCFPAPDGSFSGPSHMSARCSSDPPREQWQFAPKNIGAGMITDEAIHISPLPTLAEIQAAPTLVATKFNEALAKGRKDETAIWKETHWSRGLNFPYDNYVKGYYDKRVKLEAEKSPLTKPLYERKENFVREFNKAFVIARYDKFATAIHTGEVGGMDGHWHRPYGFGGGQMSAFWTPETGVTVLGRRRGIQGKTFDSWDEWRIWPVHAVAGVTPAGDLVTSARIQLPETQFDKDLVGNGATVKVAGNLPRHIDSKHQEVPTGIQYQRTFKLSDKGVKVTTALTSKGTETFTELYETIPVLIAELGEKPTTIQFRIGESWVDAGTEPTANVTAVKTARFKGDTVVTFAKPVRAKLSPTVWADGYQTTAQCRTVLVDLLDDAKKLGEKTSIEYVVSPGK